MRVEHGGEYALVASQGGSPKHPVWYYNLVADPRVTIQDGPEPFEADVRLVTGDERAEWWERAVAAYPPYAEYQEKTERQIPVFVDQPPHLIGRPGVDRASAWPARRTSSRTRGPSPCRRRRTRCGRCSSTWSASRAGGAG